MFINCFTLRNCCEKSPQESRNYFFFLVFVKKVIMGSPACSTDVLAEYSTARAV